MKFESREDLAAYLYDRALTPGMSGTDRLRLAIMAADRAESLWREYA